MGIIIFLGNRLGIWVDLKFQTNFLEDTITLMAVFLAMFMIIFRVNRFNKND